MYHFKPILVICIEIKGSIIYTLFVLKELEEKNGKDLEKYNFLCWDNKFRGKRSERISSLINVQISPKMIRFGRKLIFLFHSFPFSLKQTIKVFLTNASPAFPSPPLLVSYPNIILVVSTIILYFYVKKYRDE